VQVSGKHIHTDTAAMADYAARSGRLADSVRGLAGSHLAQHRSVPANCFGDVGAEAGVHSALSDHISGLHDAVHATAGSVDDLGRAVHVAGVDYTLDEQDKASIFQRLQG
jgi:hypothetical protein